MGPEFLLVVIIVASFYAIVLVSVKENELVELRLKDDLLVIEPIELNRVWSRKKRLEFLESSVSEVEIVEDPRSIPHSFKFPAILLAPFVIAGSYKSDRGRTFFLARPGRASLTVKLSGQEYSQLVLQTRDPYGDASMMRDYLPQLRAASS
jgi:hypothetical protein